MSFQAVIDFENAIAEFYGAPFAVAVDSCTHSLELCLRYQKVDKITVPTRTYLSVAFLGDKIGIDWDWKEEDWVDYLPLIHTSEPTRRYATTYAVFSLKTKTHSTCEYAFSHRSYSFA